MSASWMRFLGRQRKLTLVCTYDKTAGKALLNTYFCVDLTVRGCDYVDLCGCDCGSALCSVLALTQRH